MATAEGAKETVAALNRMRNSFAAGIEKRALRKLAATVGKQTVKRVRSTKRDPGGRPWKAWSPSYAATRRSGHSLLIDKEELLAGLEDTSGTNEAIQRDGKETLYGSDALYAQHVQRVRPFLGVKDGSAEHDELQAVLDDWGEREMRRRGFA